MIIGIDLGTTNSLAAYYTDEGPKIIPNRLGRRLTPSVVSMDSETPPHIRSTEDEEYQVYVGDSAVERGLLHPESTASVFKRDMGSRKQFHLGHKSFLAEELSSFVLRALKEGDEACRGTGGPQGGADHQRAYCGGHRLRTVSEPGACQIFGV